MKGNIAIMAESMITKIRYVGVHSISPISAVALMSIGRGLRKPLNSFW
jgi:hypothetical protein